MRVLAAAIVAGASVATACHRAPAGPDLDLDLIQVSGDARLRTDTVGEGQFEARATFVLVDASNRGKVGAYVTLGGSLADHAGQVIGHLKQQALWIPPGAERTYALVDTERAARPEASAARIEVRGATIPKEPPRAYVEGVREYDDYGKTVANGTLVNDADRAGTIMVIGTFHDVDHRPMTRPFAMVRVDAHGRQSVQFVGPPGSKHGDLYVGEVVY